MEFLNLIFRLAGAMCMVYAGLWSIGLLYGLHLKFVFTRFLNMTFVGGWDQQKLTIKDIFDWIDVVKKRQKDLEATNKNLLISVSSAFGDIELLNQRIKKLELYTRIDNQRYVLKNEARDTNDLKGQSKPEPKFSDLTYKTLAGSEQ